LGKARSASLLGHILSSTGRKQEALDLFEEARSVLTQSEDLNSEVVVLNSIAQAYADLGDCESALHFEKLALEKYAILGDRVGESYGLHLAGNCYFAIRDLTNAVSFIERARQGFQGLSNDRRVAFCWRDLGIVYHSVGETKKALDNLNRALEIS